MLLVFLALGVIFVASYELSSEVRAWTRDFLEAISAHRRADRHMTAAGSATEPAVAVWHTHAAAVANQEAARKTSQAAGAARTESQRKATARSIAAITDRESQITAAFARLGVGQCGVRSYAHVTTRVRDTLLARLHDEGMTITGSNPWDVDTHNHDVKLRALWDPSTLELRLVVTSGQGGFFGLVTCSSIWERIDPVIKEVIGERSPA